MEQTITVAAPPVTEKVRMSGSDDPGPGGKALAPCIKRQALWMLTLVVAYWWMLLQRLSVDWTVNPQYGYGWSVPVLACWLAWRRWADRPPAELSQWCRPSAMMVISLLLFLLPVRLIEEANPEWRLVLWFHALTLAALTAGLLLYSGGGAWLRHFGFPVCFVLVSVPWPSGIEQTLIQGLTKVVAGVTVEILGLCGIMAVQHGNLIEVSTGIVGVDEACSGVRSLQTSVMISLFLGELYRFTFGRRLLMLALGMALALVTNLCRTFFLVWSAAQHGIKSVDQWHDTAGLVIVGVVFAGLWLLAWRLRGRAGGNELRGDSKQTAPRLPSRWVLAGLTGWLVLVAGGTEAWYRAHERDLVPAPPWSVQWPTGSPAFRDVPLTEKARAILRCDAARGAAWRDEARNLWLGFFLEWKPGRNSAQLAKGHTPDICMPAAGQRLVRELGLRNISVRGLELSFRRYEFTSPGRPLFVFYCNWESARSPRHASLREDWTATSRLESVRFGKRHLGQQVLQLAVEGPRNVQDAEAALARELEWILRAGENSK